jgi:uncharacterized protein YuzE
MVPAPPLRILARRKDSLPTNTSKPDLRDETLAIRREISLERRHYGCEHSADALYLRLDDSKIIESEEVAPGVILDYNDKDEVVGVEMLYLSKRTPNLKTTALEFESV